VYTTWRLDTRRHSANPCPAFLVVVTYARLVVVNWTFHVSIWLRTGDGRLPMPVPHLGTLYLTVSKTLILLCKPSNAILRLSFLQRAQCSHCKRCISYGNSVCLSVSPSVCLSVCLSVTRRYCVKTTARSTVQFAPLDSKMCLVL